MNLCEGFRSMSKEETAVVNGGLNLVDLGVGIASGVGMLVGGPVGIGIGLVCTAYSITRAFDE